LDENYLPDNFEETVHENISPSSMKVWEKVQELKQKKKYKKKKTEEKEPEKIDLYINSSKYSRGPLFNVWEKDSLEKDSL
jgi:3-polyprenyl-4-hydroxybenzoate decarboxylase